MRLQEELIHLLTRIMQVVEIPSIVVPSNLHSQLTRKKLGEEDSILFDRSGVLHFKIREGEVHELKEYPTDLVINIFNAIAPILKEEVAKRRKAEEDRLEALQALKSSLAALEKRQVPK